jgi:glutamate racemase
MRIGVFDSGLGGLLITRSLITLMPHYDYVYLGDTARVPYGNRSESVITMFTLEGVRYLLDHDCNLVIVACNTASSEALREIQQNLLPHEYPQSKVLGVLIPAAESAVEATQTGKIGVLATTGTVTSMAFVREIQILLPTAQISQQPAPLLVPLLEHDGKKWVIPILEKYLAPLLEKNIDTLILGCTHYPLVKDEVRQICGLSVSVICQDEIIPKKLDDYLSRHPEIAERLSQNSSQEFNLTDITPHAQSLAETLFSRPIPLRKAYLNSKTGW